MLVALLPAATWAQGARDQFGTVAATAVEGMVAVAFPGSHVEWGNEVFLVAPEQDPRQLFLPGFLQRPESDGFLFATAFEFPAEVRAAWQAIAASQPPLETQTIVALFRSNSAGSLMEHRSGVLDTSGAPARCLDMEVSNAFPDAPWPKARVRFRTFHELEAGPAAVEWTALVEFEPFRTIERLPVRVMTGAPGSSQLMRTIVADQSTAGEVTLRARETGAVLRLPCSDGCIVTPEAVLEHEW